jgi:glucuronoarabinoxylan endo-1,4-beta-xylanase
MTCSWGPPAYLKSNNNKNNGGTIKYTVSDGKVNFDYAGFANWWRKSLDNYAANGVYPKYVSIQNEPDWKADYESCLLNPNETFSTTDTIAAYSKALYAVYDSIQGRANKPLLIGPETVGFGYNQVENYINALDVSKIDAISHHLYHDVDSKNPYTCATFTKLGSFHPEIPHMQTEYSLGDWYSLAGLIYKSLYDEKVTAYVYWDLVWPNDGIVSIDFPWDRNQWKNPNGYELTKDFYAFKQYSAFIHPGWQRVRSTLASLNTRSLAFLNPQKDSATFIVLNLSDTDTTKVYLSIPGYSIDKSSVYTTSADKNCQLMGSLIDSTVTVEPHSVTTVQMQISLVTGMGDDLKDPSGGSAIEVVPNYPNPFSTSTKLNFSLKQGQETWLKVFDSLGRNVDVRSLGFLPAGSNQIDYQRGTLNSGLYFYKIENANGESGSGRFMIRD